MVPFDDVHGASVPLGAMVRATPSSYGAQKMESLIAPEQPGGD
jgi:hypothetical protein